MVRPNWQHSNFFKNLWREKDITILVCQRKTKDLIQLNLESILRFYPDIPIVVVDGDSQDDSTLYLKWMQLKHSNIKVWFRGNKGGGKHTSHGVTMDEAIFGYIDTKYVLIMDSDTIMDRSGCVEGMLAQMEANPNMFATGTLMLVSNAGDACRPPENDEDILRYSHPSCSLMRADIYKRMKAKFCDHGAPSVYVMKEAAQNGFEVGYFPIHLYVSHLSGSSWTEPRTIWNHDHDVCLRPFITFVLDGTFEGLTGSLVVQSDKDFNIVTPDRTEGVNKVVLHGGSVGGNNTYHECPNKTYNLRFKLNGEYVCVTSVPVTKDFVERAKSKVIELGAPDHFELDGIRIVKRNYWQLHECFRQ